MLVTCDYLELYLLGKFNGQNTASFSFVKRDMGTKMYNDVYDVLYKGVNWGVFLTGPRMKTLKAESCHLKLSNEELYTADAQAGISAFTAETGLVFKGVTRLDVACDFHEFVDGLTPQKFVELYLTGAIVRRGKPLASFAPHYISQKGESGHSETVLTGVSFGSRTSERFGRMYNKSLLLQKENKPYITAWHNLNGLVGKDVWRLEFTLKGRELKKLFVPNGMSQRAREALDIPLVRVLSTEHVLLEHSLLAGIFETELRSFFTFVEGGSHENRSKRLPIELLDFSQYSPRPDLLLRVGVKRASSTKTERYKRAVKTLLNDYYVTKQLVCLEVACCFIRRYNLHAIVQKRFDYWYKEFLPYVDENYAYVSLLDMLYDIPQAD
jgi:hypothetical protein